MWSQKGRFCALLWWPSTVAACPGPHMGQVSSPISPIRMVQASFCTQLLHPGAEIDKNLDMVGQLHQAEGSRASVCHVAKPNAFHAK